MAAAVTRKSPFNNILHDAIQNSKVLVVGAGGIGCEILKNLVLSKFPYIEIIDLDTIDLSNLNRQFLFQQKHIGKSKAVVARETALTFNPDVTILAHHDSITSESYGYNFFKKFTIVLNALDNRQARNHVNRMCLTADVPLIESGTSGYNGQVEMIKRGMSLCYECTEKAPEKTFPGCTIRNTPSEPIHCIVWAKHLFNQLFGEADAEDISPDTEDVGATKSSDITEKANVSRTSTRKWAENCDFNVNKLFTKLFHDDIKYLLTMKDLWRSRPQPQPYPYPENIKHEAIAGLSSGTKRETIVWSVEQSVHVFSETIPILKETYNKLKEKNASDHMVWDKDDTAAMDFVTACANIRAYVFGIPRKSRFDIKSMAGNIIPAIANTNAMTAGLVVLHAFKVLQNQFDKCTTVYVRSRPNGRNHTIVPEHSLTPPNPKCYVCSEKNEVTLFIDTKKVTLKSFRDDVLIKTLNMIKPDCILSSKAQILLSSDEEDTQDCDDKFISEMSVVDGCILKADDFFQQYELNIIIRHFDADREEALFRITSQYNVPSKTKENTKSDHANGTATATDTNNTSNSTENNNSVGEAMDVDNSSLKKDESVEDGDGPSTSKRMKLSEVNADDSDDLFLVEDE